MPCVLLAWASPSQLHRYSLLSLNGLPACGFSTLVMCCVITEICSFISCNRRGNSWVSTPNLIIWWCHWAAIVFLKEAVTSSVQGIWTNAFSARVGKGSIRGCAYGQAEALTLPVVVSRLINARRHLLALRIATLLGMGPEKARLSC